MAGSTSVSPQSQQPVMELFKTFTSWSFFKRVYCQGTPDSEVVRGAKTIYKHSIPLASLVDPIFFQSSPGNSLGSQHATLVGLFYLAGTLSKVSRVVLVISLVVTLCNYMLYQRLGPCELRDRVQRTGPLVPTLLCCAPDDLTLLNIMLLAFEAAGPACGIPICFLVILLLGLGSGLMSEEINDRAGTGTTTDHDSNV
ncbi:hypothetical protein DL96DRAFT_1782350 [Flagelloscypha sp. PMI_526]|nr:hypothetical protein DL96DRAFT_1782350 [Flagelloscypha sp. PMI_526]